MKEKLLDPLLWLLGAAETLVPATPADDWSVIVPVRDQPEATARCLDSVARHAPGAEVIIIDDASERAQTRELIAIWAGRPGWRALRNESPLGHTAANHQGVAASSRRWLCLINSDAMISRPCLGPLAALLSRPGVGCVGPSTSQTSTAQALGYARWRRAAWSPRHVDGYGRFNRLRHAGRAPVELPYVGGFALCLARSTWDSCGGFDPTLPDYGNEKDLCLLLTRRGLKNYWLPSAYAHHLGNLSYARLGASYADRSRAEADRYIASKARAPGPAPDGGRR